MLPFGKHNVVRERKNNSEICKRNKINIRDLLNESQQNYCTIWIEVTTTINKNNITCQFIHYYTAVSTPSYIKEIT